MAGSYLDSRGCAAARRVVAPRSLGDAPPRRHVSWLICVRTHPPGVAGEGIADSSGVLWAPTADILLTVSSAQPGRSGGFHAHCYSVAAAALTFRGHADYALAFQRTCSSAFEEDSGVGVASAADALASCALPGGGTRSLRRENAALTTFAVAYRGPVYAVAVTATQGAVAASAAAEASAAPLQAAPGMLLQLNATAAATSQAVLSSVYLVAANATDEGVLMPAAQVGDDANKLCVSPQSWTQCNPCAASLGACTVVPAGGQRQRDQLYSFRGTTLASVLSSSRGVACSFVAAASASPAPGGGAASQAVHCLGDGASVAQVTLSLSRFSVVRQGASPPSPPPEASATASVPSSNASMLPPFAGAACGSGGACSRASGSNCTCAHGTLTSATSGVCSCVCDSGWVTNPDQDVFAPVYCGLQAATQAGMGNPEVAAGAVPATALIANNGSSAALLTPSGWALIVGINVALLCICFCCFRCVNCSSLHYFDTHHLRLACRYGRNRGCGRQAEAAKQTSARDNLEGTAGTPVPRLNSLRAMSDGLRRLLAFRMRQNMLAAVRPILLRCCKRLSVPEHLCFVGGLTYQLRRCGGNRRRRTAERRHARWPAPAQLEPAPAPFKASPQPASLTPQKQRRRRQRHRADIIRRQRRGIGEATPPFRLAGRVASTRAPEGSAPTDATRAVRQQRQCGASMRARAIRYAAFASGQPGAASLSASGPWLFSCCCGPRLHFLRKRAVRAICCCACRRRRNSCRHGCCSAGGSLRATHAS